MKRNRCDTGDVATLLSPETRIKYRGKRVSVTRETTRRRVAERAKVLIARGYSLREVVATLPPLTIDLDLHEWHYRHWRHQRVASTGLPTAIVMPDVILVYCTHPACRGGCHRHGIASVDAHNVFRVNLADPEASLRRDYMNEETLLLENFDRASPKRGGVVTREHVRLLNSLAGYRTHKTDGHMAYAGVKLCARRVIVTCTRHPYAWRGTKKLCYCNWRDEMFTHVVQCVWHGRDGLRHETLTPDQTGSDWDSFWDDDE